MNVVKRRWPDLLIGLLVVLLLAGFAALLLGKNGAPTVSQTQNTGTTAAQTTATQTPATQTTATQTTATQTPATQTPATPTASTSVPTPTDTASGAGAAAATPDQNAGTGTIPTIAATPVTAPDAGSSPNPTTTPAPDAATPTAATPRAQGAVPTSEARSPTRNDYRISLGSYADAAAVQAATVGVSKLGYTVYPVTVASGVVAELGPFASREAAAQALADVQRATPGALLYSPRNAPATDSSGTDTPGTGTPGAASSSPAVTGTTAAPAPSGPVYLQVGAYNTTAGAQTAVERARALGLEPSVNAPAGKKVTVVVGPFQGQALAAAEAKLEAGGVDYFRVR